MQKLFILIISLFPILLYNCSDYEIFIESAQQMPSPPQNLSVAPGDKIAYLSWQFPVNNGGSDITEFRIYRSLSPGNGALIASVSFNTFSYNDSNLTNETTYYYYITAVNNNGEGERSNQISVRPALTSFTPSEPRNVQSTAGLNSVSLSWMIPYSEGLSLITHYRIYRGSSIGNMILLKEVNTNLTNTIDTALTSYNTYYYSVSAVNSLGEGRKSDTISAIPLPRNALTENLWVSIENDIAPALRKAPYRFVKIHTDFQDDNTYSINAKDSDKVSTTYTGTFQTTDSNSSSGIKQIILYQTSPEIVTLQGIFRADSVLTLEIIQVQPPIQGLQPPTISGGFGSTTLDGVPLGNEWIQIYRRIL